MLNRVEMNAYTDLSEHCEKYGKREKNIRNLNHVLPKLFRDKIRRVWHLSTSKVTLYNIVIPRLTKIIRSGITFVSQNLR
jgi:hypothetical protein